MYRKSVRAIRKERKTSRCAQMRSAKERIRIELSEQMRDVGGFITDGCLGNHNVRLMSYPDGERIAVTIDGKHRQARTYRGILRCIATMVSDKTTGSNKAGRKK